MLLLAALFLSTLLGCHSSILPSIHHGACDDDLPQMFECIELSEIDVKRKIRIRKLRAGMRERRHHREREKFLHDDRRRPEEERPADGLALVQLGAACEVL
ncbi:MAG TPA: hypothetical protein VGQ71_01920 [Terriglobales bacterium]|nr:hypothetical protein [Terriglobales bacterium]